MTDIDISSRIGALYPLHGAKNPPEWPMYSYERPAWMLWNGVASRLHERGWTENQIKGWLQSKEPRYALDNKLGDTMREAGRQFADTIPDSAKNYGGE